MKATAETRAKASRAAKALVDQMSDRFEQKRYRTTAVITAVQRDSAERITGAVATIDGLGGQSVQVDHGAPVGIGDVYQVENQGTQTAVAWVALRRLRSALAQPAVGDIATLPTPSGLTLLTDVLIEGDFITAWLYGYCLTVDDAFGRLTYAFEVRPDDDLSVSEVYTIGDILETVELATAVGSTDNVLPHAGISPDVLGGTTFPKRGRIKCESELIDYTAFTFGSSDSGTGTGGAGSFTDGTKTWTTNQWANYVLTVGGTNYLITSNTATVLTVSGTPGSGAYSIYPAFTGCTRGVAGSTAATHALNKTIIRRSIGRSLGERTPNKDYSVRVRTERPADGSVSNWTAWVSITTSVDVTPPTAPTDFSVTSMLGGAQLSWTGPILADVRDLAGFRVYRATSDTGTGATAIKDVGIRTETFIELYPPGTSYYFNLKAFDQTGNESAYAVATWLLGRALLIPGYNILINADMERDWNADSLPDWYCWGSTGGGQSYAYGTSYGYLGSKGVRLSLPTDTNLEMAQSPVGYYGGQNSPLYKCMGVGTRWTFSVYVKPSVAESLVQIGPPTSTADKVVLTFKVSVFDTGLTEYPLSISAFKVMSLNDGWLRIACVATEDVWLPEPLTPWAIGVFLAVYNNTDSSVTVDTDRWQFELGEDVTNWQPCLNSGTTGLLFDVGGIVSTNLMVDDDGTITEALVDGYMDFDGISTPANPASGTRRLFVDSGTGKISVRTSAGVTVSLEETSGGVTDHGALSGLGDDDHTQYTGHAQSETITGAWSLQNYLDVIGMSVPANPASGTRRLFVNSATGELSVRTSGGTTVSLEAAGGVTDHGALTGLGDDDHTQYLNNSRHDLTDRHTLGTVVPHDALASLTERSHASLTNVTADQHHNRSHALTSTSDHTATGLTTGYVIRATGATTFAWAQLQHTDLGGVSADQHHNRSHALTSTSDHTATGLTTGYVIRATGATTFAWAQLQHTDLGGVSADQHHAGFIGLEDHSGTGVTPAADDYIQLLTGNSILSITAGTNTITLQVNQGSIDHGSIGGLGDDDHTQYAEHANAETITGGWQWSIALLPSATDTYDLGSSTKLWRKGWLSELESILFVENTVQVSGGWSMWPHAQGTLAADVTGGGTPDTTVDFGTAMTENDFVVLRGNLQVEYMQVGTLVSGTTYNVTRNLDGSGANDWPQGQVFVVLGYTGDGRVEIDAQTSGPRLSVFVQGSSYNSQTEYARLGHLNGWGPIATDIYGWAAGDYAGNQYAYYAPGSGLFVRGTITADAGTIGGWTLTSTELHNTNIWLDADAKQIAVGSQTFGADGIQLEYNSGNPRAYIGNGATDATGRYFNFNGTTITWKAANTELDSSGNLTATSATLSGAITATSGSIGGWTITTGHLYSGSGATRTGLQPASYPFYAGSETPSEAPFRVTPAGALTADTATITGSITATGGSFTGTVTITGSGELTAGGGLVTLDTQGITIDTSGSPTSPSQIKWDVVGRDDVVTIYGGGTSVTGGLWLYSWGLDQAGGASQIQAVASMGTWSAMLTLDAQYGASPLAALNCQLLVDGGLCVGNYQQAISDDEVEFWDGSTQYASFNTGGTAQDGRLLGGFTVGSISYGASSGEIECYNGSTLVANLNVGGNSGDLRLAGGLTLGSATQDASAGEIDIRSGTTLLVNINPSGGGDGRFAGGLAAGYVSAAPANGELELYYGTTLVVNLNAANAGDGRFAGGLIAGSATTNPANGCVEATADGRFAGGVYAGSRTTDAATGCFVGTGDVRVAGGVGAGSSTTDVAGGCVRYTGNLVSYKGTTEHDVYAFHPLTTPLTNSLFGGGSYSDGATGTISYNHWSTPIPTDAKALLVDVSWRDSGSGGSSDLYFALGPSSTYWYGMITSSGGYVTPADSFVRLTSPVVCGASGSLYYKVVASGASTMDIWVRCWGYWV